MVCEVRSGFEPEKEKRLQHEPDMFEHEVLSYQNKSLLAVMHYLLLTRALEIKLQEANEND